MNKPSARRFKRFLNPDGTFNLARPSRRTLSRTELYPALLGMSWPAFFLGLAILFLLTNLLFGTLYWFAGAGLENVRTHGTLDHYLDCFFFSVQTLATIGYGKIAPISTTTNLLVTLEALLGMLFVPVATGLVFVRFSRPTAKVQFSRNALIRSYDGEPYLVFRVANARMNQIIDAEIRVTLIHAVKTAEGEVFREFKPLTLSQNRTPLFAMAWVVEHPITPQSPLYGKAREALAEEDIEIIVTLTGLDETMNQTIHARSSYTLEDLRWDHRFEDMLTRDADDNLVLHLERMDHLQKV